VRRRSSDSLPAFFAELRAWAAARGITASTHAYGSHPDQQAELRLPPGDGPHRVAIVVHGGFWYSEFSNETTHAVATALTEAGWATWNIEYRRIGSGGGYPTTLDDVAAACAAIRELDAPVDPDRVVSIGHSAAEGLVAGAVALAGVCDLVGAAEQRVGEGAAIELMGTRPEEAVAAWARADPRQRLPVGVPVRLVHGTHDDRVPVSQSREFARAAQDAGDDCRLHELGCDHFDVIDPRSGAWPEILRALAAVG
jgi:acetyl esterase/lipase